MVNSSCTTAGRRPGAELKGDAEKPTFHIPIIATKGITVLQEAAKTLAQRAQYFCTEIDLQDELMMK